MTAEASAGAEGGIAPRRRGRPRERHDPWRPQGVKVEEERGGDGAVHPWLTVFLTGAECPFGCVFCDLWRHTLEGATPPGALPAQVRAALASPEVAPVRDDLHGIKLYNASNLFEPRAVPPEDDAPLAEAVAGFARVVAECHPRLVADRCMAFARRLEEVGGKLEVAMGLETIHPEALPRLGKAMDLDLFAGACDRLLAAGCAVRAFVLVGAPYVPAEESVDWAVRSAEWAFGRGVSHVSLIPVRGGTPEMEALREAGEWSPPRLADLEDALHRALAAAPTGAVVTADLWDLERFAGCDACFARRRDALGAANLSGRPAPPVACNACGGRGGCGDSGVSGDSGWRGTA